MKGLLALVLIFYSIPIIADSSLRSRIKIQKRSHILKPQVQESEDYSIEKIDVLSKKRQALILDIKRFLRESRSVDQKAELNLRLGALYMEDYYAEMARAQAVFEKQTLAFQNKQTHRKPALDTSEANASLDKARVIYRDLLKLSPNHSRKDEILYFLAIAAMDKGQSNEAMHHYQSIVNETPKSKYYNESLVQLGDFYFDKNQFSLAEGYYEKIIQRKDKRLLPYSVYKKAWCSYNSKKTELALQQFKWVIANEDQNANAPIRIKNEALRDITLPFVDLKLADESIAYFDSHGEQTYRRGVETMAGLYLEQGDYKNAIHLYENLLGHNPNYGKNAAYDISIIEAHHLAAQRNLAIERLFSRLPNYMKGSSWYEINSNSAEVIKEAHTRFEELARKYALMIHAEGQKTKNDELYATAKQLYSKYLEFFPNTVDSPKIRFYLAEIQFRKNEFVPSADNYFLVYKDPRAGTLKLDSIRYSLTALDKELNLERKKLGLSAITKDSKTKLKEDEDDKDIKGYTPVESKFISISGVFMENHPKEKEAPAILYQSAYLQYTHYDFSPAYKNFWHIIQNYPTHVSAYPSAYLVMDILNRKKDYLKLIAACKKFLDTRVLSKQEFKSEVANVLRHAELKRIALLEDQGKFKEAADEYVEYTKAYGSQDEALYEKALYNASVNYTKVHLLITAAETQEKFLRRFPKSALRQDMLLQVAKTYEILAIFGKSATYYQEFAQSYPSHEQAQNALRLSGLYYWGAGNSQTAEGVMRQFLAKHPSESKKVETELLSLYESQGATEKQIRYYLEDRSRKGIPLSQYLWHTVRIAELMGEKSGKISPKMMDEAMAVIRKFHKEISQSPRGVEAMAKVSFWAANQKEEEFYRIRLELPQKRLEANLSKKLAILKALEADYGNIAAMGSGEWGLASMYKTGAAYRQMAQEVQQAPVPAELSAEQIDMYRQELQRQMVQPFNEKALNMTVSCMDKSQEFNVHSDWTARCYALAGELDPSRYPAVRTFYLPPVHVAILVPENGKIEIGNYKNYAYPYYSTELFKRDDKTRSLASVGLGDLPSLYDATRNLSERKVALPVMVNYQPLFDERQNILVRAFQSEKPGERKRANFAALNLMRTVSPQKAVPYIMEAITIDPQNEALHNLLGLAYFELGNRPAARVTWLSMIARGVKNSAIWNNLGVLEYADGKETAAIEYFKESMNQESPKEAHINMGFIALKYRSGFEAKKYFEKALSLESEDVTAQIGLAVARLQNRELDGAKESLGEATKKFRQDPFARLSFSYFLLDVEKENQLAGQLLTEYAAQQAVENDMVFRQAIQEAKSLTGRDGLPSLEE